MKLRKLYLLEHVKISLPKRNLSKKKTFFVFRLIWIYVLVNLW